MREFMLALLTCSVTMSAIALIHITVSPLLSKYCSAKSRYYAWLIVVIGLLIPFRPSFNHAIVEINIPAVVVNVTPPEDYAVTSVEAVVDSNGTVDAGRSPMVNQSIGVWQIAFIVWAAGAALLFVYQALRHIRFVRTTKRWSVAATSDPAHELLQNLKENAGLKKSVSLFRCPCITTPMAIGLFRCKILLPHLDFEQDELRYILMHELFHLKRNDLLYRTLTMIATAVHWFNPIVYLTGRAFDLLCEVSCDEEIVRELGADARLRYSETIIGVVRRQTSLQTAFSTSFYGGEKGMRMRILSIMDVGWKKAGAVLVCTALIISAGTGFVFDARVVTQDVSAADTAATAPIERREIMDILENWDVAGRIVLHDSFEGQIGRERVAEIAQAAVPRLMRHLIVNPNGSYNVETQIVDMYLGQSRSSGQEETPIDPKFSFWTVIMSVSGETSLIQMAINAQTGAVLTANMQGLRIESDTVISAEKLLSGFMADLSLGGFEYEEDGYITGSELNALGEITAARDIEGSGVGVSAAVFSEPYMKDGESFDSYTNIFIIISVIPQIPEE